MPHVSPSTCLNVSHISSIEAFYDVVFNVSILFSVCFLNSSAFFFLIYVSLRLFYLFLLPSVCVFFLFYSSSLFRSQQVVIALDLPAPLLILTLLTHVLFFIFTRRS